MFELKIKSDFSSAHRLYDYNGQCENFHGHNWKVYVTVKRDSLDPAGMVIDFKVLLDIIDGFLSKLDHQYLNELEYFNGLNPTSENVAWIIYNNIAEQIEAKAVKVIKVEVYEEDHSSAAYIPDN